MAERQKNCVISLSGGMDSTTVLLRCLTEYENITAVSFDYGQKHSVELKRARELVDFINSEKTFSYRPYINYRVIRLDGLVDLLSSNLTEGGEEIPEGHYQQDNMKLTVVPNRNKMFSSIIQAVALSMTMKNGLETDIAMGIHSGDHDIYPDCRQEFRDADMEAFRLGNWESEKVGVYTPYLKGDKHTILEDGLELCKVLGLDFDEIYKRTNTSYKPYPSGNSDIYSASSIERIEAFMKLGLPDPVQYEDKDGEVEWEEVVKRASKILNTEV